MRQGTRLLVQGGPQHETRNAPIGTGRATVLVLDKERAYWYREGHSMRQGTCLLVQGGPQYETRNVPIGTERATV